MLRNAETEHTNTYKHAEQKHRHPCSHMSDNHIHCDHCNENRISDDMQWLVGGQGIVGHTSPLWAG